MRTWLFYKHIDDKLVTFRRVDEDGVTVNLPDAIRHGVTFHGGKPTEKEVAAFVSQNTGWVGEPPRSVDHPIAATVLRGRW